MIEKKNCSFHPTKHAHFTCESCGNLFCDSCVCKIKNPSAVNAYHYMCPKCNVELTPLGVSHMVEPFWKRLASFFKYPFQQTPMTLIILMALGCTTGLLLLESGFTFLIILYYCYLIAMPFVLLHYCNGVLISTAKGNLSDPPALMEVESDFPQIFKQFILIVILSGFGVLKRYGDSDTEVIISLVVLFFQPAILLILVANKSILQALNPLRLIALIHGIGWPYLMLSVFSYFLFFTPILIPFLLPDFIPYYLEFFLEVVAWQYYLIVIYHLLGYVTFQYQEVLGLQVEYSDYVQKPSADKILSSLPVSHQIQQRLLTEVNILVKEGELDEALELIRVNTKGKFEDVDLGLRCVSLLEQCGKSDVIPVISKGLLDLLADENRCAEGMALYKKCLRKDSSFSLREETLCWLLECFQRLDDTAWVECVSVQLNIDFGHTC